MTALLAGGVAVPTALSAPAAQAAEACRSGIPTYVHDVSESGGVLRKYMDLDPLTGNATGALVDTGQTAPLEAYSEFFTGGHGIIYVITPEGALKTYKDNSATGGSMLTPVHDYGGNWTYDRTWSTGDNRIFALRYDGALEVYSVASPSSGSGAITKVKTVAATDPAVVAMTQAQDVWSVGATVYTLRRGVADRLGEVKAWRYSESASGSPFPDGPSIVVTGIGTKVRQGWSPGPGTIYTLGDTPDYTGVARSYTGTDGMSTANAEVGAGMYGDVHADIAACLASPSPDIKPTFGPVSPESEVPPQAVTDESADPAPQNPTEFSGKFVLGDGSPAAGLPVTVEAVFATNDSDEEVKPPTLGTTVTASDGTWTVPLPEKLPESVQKAAVENGGAVNAMASVQGKTSSGLTMLGTDTVTAAPTTAPATARALVAAAAEDTDEPSKLRPITADMSQEQVQPTAAQTALSWASKDERISVDTLGDKPLPEYQSDTVADPQSNPYIVDGVDTKSMVVRPKDGGCDKDGEKVIERGTAYTAVVEGHAYWDAKASVDYDSKLSSNVEVAYKTGKNWTIEGSVTLGSSMSVTTGYANKGPFYGKQWKVPIEYRKIKETWHCDYGHDTFYRYKIIGGKYKIPSGGAVGKYGKDVSNKDGMAYLDSPKSHRAWVAAGSYFQISKNHSIKYGAAVTAFGVKLGASTQFDKEHKQRITAGNRKNARHDIWGKNDRLSGKPGVFYSY
ncbi:hypothetical protein [Streptomyces achromogenes]|uniref:hypothetical protein n=1 Tax=Streptomyces achromogenes TaxID=67255 RepID=UPI00370259FC